VHTAVGNQADEVQGVAAISAALEGVGQRGIRRKVAVVDRLVDARQILVDDPSGSHVRVADLGVAHLSGRQTDGFARSDEPRVRIARQQPIVDGRSREGDRVVVPVGANAEPVQDEEYEWMSHDRICEIANCEL
jgi:hypothetical protein